MKEVLPKGDIWSSYGTKLAAAGCKQAVNDDERCQSFGLVFFQHKHKLFGNIHAITFFKPPDFTNRQILTPICGYGKETFLQISSYHWRISIGRCTCISYMWQLRKCSHVVNWDSARKFVTFRLFLVFDVVTQEWVGAEACWRYREITSSSFGYNKYLRRSAKWCRKLAFCFRSEAGRCSRYLDISISRDQLELFIVYLRKKEIFFALPSVCSYLSLPR